MLLEVMVQKLGDVLCQQASSQVYHYTCIYQCLSVNVAPSGSTCRSSYTGPVAACPLAGFSVFKRLDMPDFVEQIPSSCMEGTHTPRRRHTHTNICVRAGPPVCPQPCLFINLSASDEDVHSFSVGYSLSCLFCSPMI